MGVGGIVAEYNPFHNGHLALIEAARRAGSDRIVAVMSGNFVQRADLAVADKQLRAACALEAGVDLVVELPLAWATAGAQHFARGAVYLLQALGCVDTLCFGSEIGRTDTLLRAAQAIDDPAVLARMRELLAQGMTFARARFLAVEEILGEDTARPLAGPNDTLGMEYLRQARLLDWPARPFVLRRSGAAHDADRPAGHTASASWLRERAGQPSAWEGYIPPGTAARFETAAQDGLFPARMQALETAVLARLRLLDRESLSRLPDLSEGLENRLYRAIRSATSLAGLQALLKTKRYTMARVRRLILSAFLGVERADVESTPPYVRILGFTPRGRQLLGRIKERCLLPAGTSLRRLAGQNTACARAATLEARATDLYALALPKPQPCGTEYSARAVTG